MTPSVSEALVPVMLSACLEFVAPHSSTGPVEADLPSAPGGVVYDDTGCPLKLHIAPRRWLVPYPDDALRQTLLSVQSRGLGAVTDVDGKWQWFRAEGSAALRLLESTIDVNETLTERECASTTLFDCPAIIARRGKALDLWITSSYLASFRAAAQASLR
jgi:hypothetical protein